MLLLLAAGHVISPNHTAPSSNQRDDTARQAEGSARVEGCEGRAALQQQRQHLPHVAAGVGCRYSGVVVIQVS